MSIATAGAFLVAAPSLADTTASPPTNQKQPEQRKQYKRVKVIHRYRHYHGGKVEGQTTYYSPGTCDSTGGGTITADEGHVFFGEVANSVLPFGTKIEVHPAIKGRTDFVVKDRFGSYQPLGRLDVWVPCGDSIPNPIVTFRIYTEELRVFYRRVLIR